MSCHDGVTSVNTLQNNPGLNGTVPTMAGLTGNLITGDANLGGGNLTNDHPIAVAYNTAYASLRTLQQTDSLVVKVSTSQIVLGRQDNTSKIQCESCHDVHSSANPAFLRAANTGSALCLACHQK
jgi:predicted CXXCH cytochrome family protein